RRLIGGLAQEGLLPRLFPRRAGGIRDEDVSAVDLGAVREALAKESTVTENAIAIQTLGAYPIVLAGSDEQADRYAGPVARGEAVAAFALTEPGAGTDAGALALRAERDGKGYRLSGTKVFISNAPDADVYTVFARTTAGTGTKGITAFIVNGDAKGLSGTVMRLLSAHPIGRLELDGVLVSDQQVLGDVDGGFKLAMRTLELFRPSVGASVVGMAQAALHPAPADLRGNVGDSARNHCARPISGRRLTGVSQRPIGHGQGQVTERFRLTTWDLPPPSTAMMSVSSPMVPCTPIMMSLELGSASID